MDNPPVAAALNRLLDAEQLSLTPHLAEMTLFMTRLDVAAGDVARSMAAASRTHRAALTDLILDLGGQPVPRHVSPVDANLHYLDFHFVLPRLLDDQQKLISTYREWMPRLASSPAAAALAARIVARHESDLAQLRALANPRPAPQTA